MSMVYEAIVLCGDDGAVQHAFDALSSALAFRLLRFPAGGFAVLCVPRESGRNFASNEVDRLAAALSIEFGTTLAVHYDDRCGMKVGRQFRTGELVREVGEADEVWVQLDEQGEPLTDGPRFAGDGIPPGVECDCIRQAIDAGLETAGFSAWLNAAALRNAVSLSEA